MNNYDIVFPVPFVGKAILIFIVLSLFAFAGFSYYKKDFLLFAVAVPGSLFFAIGIYYKSEVRIDNKTICVVKTYVIPMVKKCFDINNVRVFIREKNGTVDLASATSFHVVLESNNRVISITDYPELKEAELLKNKIEEYIQACLQEK